MKNVLDPKTNEIIVIDETKEPNWKTKYLHRSWKPFEIDHNEESQVSWETVLNDISIEELQWLYEWEFWKKVPVNKKNDKEWIISKLS